MINVRQTPRYAAYMRSIHWYVENVSGVYVFVKKFPLLPGIIKIQRPQRLPSPRELTQLMRKYHARSITVEPAADFQFKSYKSRSSPDPYTHTKTLLIDLTPGEQEIFRRFTSAKRRAVRKALSLGVIVEQSHDVDAFIHLKNRTTGVFLGFLAMFGFLRPLWHTFSPNNALVLLAKLPSAHNSSQPIAGIFLLHVGRIAYYWMAAATKEGKKHFAPTLLVWEALKLAKRKGCTKFDFEGTYDERRPDKNRDWQGFSKFKGGFGGKPLYYPPAFRISV